MYQSTIDDQSVNSTLIQTLLFSLFYNMIYPYELIKQYNHFSLISVNKLKECIFNRFIMRIIHKSTTKCTITYNYLISYIHSHLIKSFTHFIFPILYFTLSTLLFLITNTLFIHYSLLLTITLRIAFKSIYLLNSTFSLFQSLSNYHSLEIDNNYDFYFFIFKQLLFNFDQQYIFTEISCHILVYVLYFLFQNILNYIIIKLLIMVCYLLLNHTLFIIPINIVVNLFYIILIHYDLFTISNLLFITFSFTGIIRMTYKLRMKMINLFLIMIVLNSYYRISNLVVGMIVLFTL